LSNFDSGKRNLIFPKRSFLQQIAFHAGDEAYTWQDVFFAAKLAGDWQKLEWRTAQSIAARDRFAEQEEGVAEEEIEKAATQFRSDRDLISAEELEAWLRKRELTVEEWYDYIERMLFLEMSQETIEEHEIDLTSQEFCELLEIDGICSGQFRQFAFHLSGQAALDASEYSISVGEAEIAAFKNSLPPEVQNYSGIARLIRLKLKIRQYESTQITENKIRERVQAQPLDFIRFDLRLLTFSDQSQAAEGALCIREDGERPSDISRFAGARLVNLKGYLEELDSAYRNELAGAQPKEIIGPLPDSTGQYVIIYVASKTSPSIKDPEVCARAKQKLLESVINYEVNNRVQWHMDR
jgi:hypothetical protein